MNKKDPQGQGLAYKRWRNPKHPERRAKGLEHLKKAREIKAKKRAGLIPSLPE